MSSEPINVVFIGGTGRSGTNITKTILYRHLNVASLPFEYRYTIDPHGLIDTYISLKQCWSPFIAHAKIDHMRKFLLSLGRRKTMSWLVGKIIKFFDPTGKCILPPPYFEWELEKWFPNYYYHANMLIEKLSYFQYRGCWPGENGFKVRNSITFLPWNFEIELIFRDFLRSMISDLLKKCSKTHFVEDNTWNILFSNELKEILPEAKFIHVIRDPRDVVTSLMKQRWAPSEIHQCIQFYSSIMDKMIQNKKTLSDNSLYEFKLETLVADQNATIEKICNFCCLKFSNDLLEIDLSHANSGRWMKDLSTQDQKILNKKLEYYVNFYEYDTPEGSDYPKDSRPGP